MMSRWTKVIAVSLALVGAGATLGGGLRLQAVDAAAPRAQTRTAATTDAAASRVLLNQYCVTCHNERMKTADLMLDKLDVQNVASNAETWEKVVRKLRSQAMPPAGSRRPDAAQSAAFATWVENELDRSAAARPNPGRPIAHRLNRLEYTNAIRDLLAINIDARSMLPTDESGYGFDNIADVLSVSPGLLERYLVAARRISREAVGDVAMKPEVEIYRVPGLAQQYERMNDDLPAGTRGGAAFRHTFPLDGEYVVKVNLRRSFNNNAVLGADSPEQLDVRLDGARLDRFVVGGACAGSKEPNCIVGAGINGASQYQLKADDPLRIRFPARAGRHLVSAAFLRKADFEAEGATPERLTIARLDSDQSMGVASIQIEGPFNPTGTGDTPSRRKIFVCKPAGLRDEDACARQIVTALARRAYRRPVGDRDLQTLMGFYRTGRSKGFEAGIQFALEGMLISPSFLLRVVADPPNAAAGAVYRVSDIDLASRLSFFLWSSIPDDQLLDVAARGQLRDPKVLEQQVRRMLADPRAGTLVTNFAAQWLFLRDLRAMVPDPRVFPDFDDSLRDMFQRETELFLESQFREDHPLIDLLTANYTFLNERLAKFYDVPNVYGTHFRRVRLTDPNRAGLLGQASILTVTSYPTRTSPVIRGKWILSNILGAPPAPPPPDVPALKENGEAGAETTSIRARMEQHRKNAICAGCHARMDPLGFALENFNGIGKWRTTDSTMPIDSSGAFPDGTRFTGPAEFRTALLGHRDEFVRNFTEKLMTYALGRGAEYYDMPAIRAILRESAPSNDRWSSLIVGVAKSMPFQMRAVPREASSAKVAQH